MTAEIEIFDCPYLAATVELSAERKAHITERHPDLLPDHFDRIAETLSAPEQVRRSERFGNARLFTRWFDSVRSGKYVVIVVVNEHSSSERHWIITAYIARKLSGGTVEWTKTA
jgi:hypothetical protein